MITKIFAALKALIDAVLTVEVTNSTGQDLNGFIEQFATENEAVFMCYTGFDNAENENNLVGMRQHNFKLYLMTDKEITAKVDLLLGKFDATEFLKIDSKAYSLTVAGGEFSGLYGMNIFEMSLGVYA